MVGREEIVLTEEDFQKATDRAYQKHGVVRLKHVADELEVSYPIFLREKTRLKLNPKTMINAQLNPLFEKKDLTEENFQDIMGDSLEIVAPMFCRPSDTISLAISLMNQLLLGL